MMFGPGIQLRRFTIAAITTGVLLLLAGVRAADLATSRAETLRASESRAANQAVIVSAYLAETFAAGDASLRQLALHNRRVGGPLAPPSEWNPSLMSAKAGLTSVGAITVVDRDGIIRHSTRTDIVGQSRSREPLYLAAVSGSGDELLVGTPLVPPAGPRAFVIPIGRRLTAADGTFEGVVVASFLPWTTREFFQAIDVGARGVAWVFHRSGKLLFRKPAVEDTSRESGPENPIFAAAARGGSGVLHAPVRPDAPVLITAYHTERDPDLITAVSFDRDEILADWTREAIASALLAALLAVMNGVGLLMLFRQMDAKAVAEIALTRAKELEAARLRHANDRLAAALEREQNARKEAEAASQLKDQFLMTVSHELRTPLTAITGWARMLVDGAVSERQKQAALRTIDRNAQAQARLIDDLLDVSRVMSGKLRLEVRMVPVEDVVRNAMDTVSPAAEAKGIHLESVVDRSAGRIPGDPERLQQIVWNLLSNAVKFTPSGGSVHVSATRSDGHVEIAVRDTGIGIGAEFLPHVFERFRQQDGGTTRRYGGLGLGLAIVRNLVELHGGSVSAHSDGENRGSLFTVRLPAAPAVPAAPEPGPSAPAVPLTAGPGALRNVRVLLVDDDGAARELFRTVLEVAGATVMVAASAAEALAAFRRAPYDVMVSDIEMPDVDGYSLLQETLAIANSRGDRFAAIAVTAYSRPEDEARSLAAGFHLHVSKPVDPGVLVAAVMMVCQPDAPGRAAEGPSGH
jgi:signal transduction histidine kinase/ActR/RegA family two-component response regulator